MSKSKNNDVIKRSVELYNAVVEEYGISSKSVLWNDQQTQYFRFAELIKNIDLNCSDKTILDVGCGNCELYKFLNFMGFRGHYTGYDINETLLEQAHSRFGNIDIHLLDIMSANLSNRFDYVLMSGLFNTNVGQSLEWIFKFIKRMFSLCSEQLVFNMITTHVNYKDEKMFYLDPAEVLSFCIEELSRRVTLAHHNLPYNFTVCVFKKQDWNSINKGLA